MSNYVATLVKTNLNQAGPLQTQIYIEQNDYNSRALLENQYSGYKVVSVLVNNQ